MTNAQRQHLLSYLGYYVGNVDGEWGQLSKIACSAFQNDFGGIAADGFGGPETDKALKHAVAYDMFKVDKDIDIPTKEPTGVFWDDIQFFTRDEFRCKCGGKYCNGFPVEMQEKLIIVADRVRDHFGAPVRVSSGVRDSRHNAAVGGVSNSRHLKGKAMDFCVQGKTSDQVLAFVQQQPEIRYAYAIDGSYVHMDIL